MGTIYTKIAYTLWATKPQILMLGLDAAGKTTIIYKMKLGEVVTTIPTVGINLETVHTPNYTLNAYDVGRSDGSRVRVPSLCTSAVRGIVFVVDSNDHDRMVEVREELRRILEDEELKGAPVLVLANKADLPRAMSAAEVANALHLPRISETGRRWHVSQTCAMKGTGLEEGFGWLGRSIGIPISRSISNCNLELQS